MAYAPAELATRPAREAPSREERSLRQTLLKYQAILENASIGIGFTREQRFEHVNPRFEEMVGWPQGTLAGQPGHVVWRTRQDYAAIGAHVGPLLARGAAVTSATPSSTGWNSSGWVSLSPSTMMALTQSEAGGGGW